MGKFKVAVTALLYIGSCIALATTHGAVSALLKSYTAGYPSSFGTHVPAFTSTALSLMPNIAIACFGTLVVSAALAALLIWRSKSRESKLYWVTVLGSINYYVSMALLSTVLIGFFLLPKLGNGT
jgi:hypothetical protein